MLSSAFGKIVFAGTQKKEHKTKNKKQNKEASQKKKNKNSFNVVEQEIKRNTDTLFAYNIYESEDRNKYL